MKRKTVVATLVFVLLISIAAIAKQMGTLNFDFIAPSVTTASDAPNQVGLIVFDSTNNKFWGKGTDSGSVWLQLSNDVTSQVPTGSLIAFAGSSAPTGYLLCDGSAVSRTTYAALYAVIGTSYGQGDGSTTFNLPDLRGKFVRGTDNGAGNDPDASSRVACATGGATGDNVGSCQADELASHNHTFAATFNSPLGFTNIPTENNAGGTTAFPTSYTGGNETRPKNVNANYLIKY